jgi:hypothetical protein
MGGRARQVHEEEKAAKRPSTKDLGLKIVRIPAEPHRRIKTIAASRGEELGKFLAWLLSENQVVRKELERLEKESR